MATILQGCTCRLQTFLRKNCRAEADGNWELMATNPSTGEKLYGYAEIANVKMPTATSSDGNLASGATT